MSEMEKILEQTKIDFSNKKPLDLSKRLDRMYSMGMQGDKNGQPKEAFILLRRWLSIVEFIKKSKDYKERTSMYSPLFSNVQINEVKPILERLEKTLTLRYMPKKVIAKTNGTEGPKAPESGLGPDNSADGSLNLPETPTEEPLASDTDEFLSCFQLFQLMQPNSRLLIIDVRPEDDYMASRIRSDQCINIPGNKIESGVIASSFEKVLSNNKEACYLFSRRSSLYVDTVVLLDWRSTRNTLFPNVEVRVLKDILQRWDHGTKCAKIKILEGGYNEWLNCYPAYVTNSHVKAPDITSDPMDEILQEVEYPDWIDMNDHTSPFNSLRITPPAAKNSKPNIVDPKISHLSAGKLSRDKPRPFYNTADSRSAIYNGNNDSTNIRPYIKEEPLDSSVNDEINEIKSELPRTTHRLAHQDSDSMNIDDEEIFTVPKKYAEKSVLPNFVPKPTIDRSSKPPNLTTQYSDCKKLLALMELLVKLMKNEKNFETEILKIESNWHYQGLRENVDKISNHGYWVDLKRKLEDVKSKKAEVKATLAEINIDEATMSPQDKKEKHTLDLSIGTEEQRLIKLTMERKRLQDKIREQEQTRQQLTPKRNETGIHKEPLKFDGSPSNSGLKRSYSSPNLAQLDDRKIPHVDRTSKPHLPIPQMPNRAINNQKKSQWRSKDREDRMEPVFRNVHPGITGLKNLGNSCYMNSIIQCLSNTAYLAKYFNDNMHIDDLNTSNDNGTQSLVADEVGHVIKALWRGQYKSISPRDLKVVIGQYKLQFDTSEQQDSHEFLTFLLDWMHNDLKREMKLRIDGPLSPAEKEWDKAMESRKSVISDLFFGQLRSSIICATCGNSSITYETFNSLTMSLPHTNRCTLDDCVKKYVSGQKVSGWKCPNCKVPREATKKFDFMKLAPVVVIHLNRFAETDGWLEKKNTSVDFPLTDFNLKPYLVPDLESSNTGNHPNHHNYSLYAVSNHYGTMDGGHYTAYCKSASQNKWYKYDDQTVTEVDRSTVKSQTASAYLLFYTSISSEQSAYRIA